MIFGEIVKSPAPGAGPPRYMGVRAVRAVIGINVRLCNFRIDASF